MLLFSNILLHSFIYRMCVCLCGQHCAHVEVRGCPGSSFLPPLGSQGSNPGVKVPLPIEPSQQHPGTPRHANGLSLAVQGQPGSLSETSSINNNNNIILSCDLGKFFLWGVSTRQSIVLAWIVSDSSQGKPVWAPLNFSLSAYPWVRLCPCVFRRWRSSPQEVQLNSPHSCLRPPTG